ncbi:LysR family transcriptional regulator [Brucella sp. JSBI001]|uniref:LysR family transcriptional regulator n=1 Tax=Brucella sp. JSBI001 TaxID=2886044 RepID=UPI00222F6526|nr:LysR family transcriptional regulator [Brucella sp. JSBI001]UZD71612.1 LysR family transcriptional regulator [Brucella sp. JSBI001]
MQHIALRYFLEVARTGSITEASAQLNVSGSAISRQISRLEAELAVELFERRPRGMVLSPAGELLVKHVRRIALDTERALADVREMRGPQRGLVRVATYEGFAVDALLVSLLIFAHGFQAFFFTCGWETRPKFANASMKAMLISALPTATPHLPG